MFHDVFYSACKCQVLHFPGKSRVPPFSSLEKLLRQNPQGLGVHQFHKRAEGRAFQEESISRSLGTMLRKHAAALTQGRTKAHNELPRENTGKFSAAETNPQLLSVCFRVKWCCMELDGRAFAVRNTCLKKSRSIELLSMIWPQVFTSFSETKNCINKCKVARFISESVCKVKRSPETWGF